jgi:hypothetical protein
MLRFVVGLATGLGAGYLIWGPVSLEDRLADLKKRVKELVPEDQTSPESEVPK